MVDIIIGGDVCPIRRNMPYFVKGDSKALFNDLLIEFTQSDLSIINLECPLIREKSPILKSGPVLGANNECINGIKNAQIKVVNLANNHILDHGANGLLNTISVCRNANIAVVGAGENLTEAGYILIRKINGVNIGVLSFAEHEFSIATNNSSGANPLSLIEYVRSIRRDRDKLDYFIVLVHGGKEYYPYPSPQL